ncbi:DedA family protein [bacterium]|nr:DedA family protein [bacterium]
MLEQIISPVAEWIKDFISQAGYAAVVVTMAIESFNIPLPSEIIMPFSGFLVFEGRFTLWGATLAGAVGNLIGSIANYFLGYYGGRPFIEKYGKYFLIKKHELDMADRFFGKYGEATVLFTRMMPIIRTFISLPAGISRMNFWRFCILTFIGAIPWCYFLTWVGLKFGENLDTFKKYWHVFDYIVILAILAGIIYWIVKARSHRNNKNNTP